MRSAHLFVIMLMITSILYAACTQNRTPCLQPKTASLIVHTKQARFDTGSIHVADTVLASPYIGAIDSSKTNILYYGPNASTLFTLSLSPAADSSRWLFGTDSIYSNFDTLTFYYTRQLHFLSNACGYTYYFNLARVNTTNHSIDSVIIENTSVTNNVNTEHLKIYIH